MSLQRRKKWTRTAAKVILVLIVLDVLAYAAADRYLANLVASEQGRFTFARLEWLRERASLTQLEKRNAALPREREELQAFRGQHIPVHREAYSGAAVLIEQLTGKSQVQLVAIKYREGKSKGEPFEHLGLDTNVEGPFPNLLKFAHGLETSNDFIVVHSFKFAAGDGGMLALHVDADLYLMP